MHTTPTYVESDRGLSTEFSHLYRSLLIFWTCREAWPGFSIPVFTRFKKDKSTSISHSREKGGVRFGTLILCMMHPPGLCIYTVHCTHCTCVDVLHIIFRGICIRRNKTSGVVPRTGRVQSVFGSILGRVFLPPPPRTPHRAKRSVHFACQRGFQGNVGGCAFQRNLAVFRSGRARILKAP